MFSNVHGQAQEKGLKACTRVLIIEDDRDLNNLLKFTLESSKEYLVESYFESNGAIQKITDFSPELIILDVMLPGGVDGKAILRELRQNSLFATVPVILLTAKSLEQDKIEGFECGADDYITKPFSPKELLLRVQALIRRSQSSMRLTGAISAAAASSQNSNQVPHAGVFSAKPYVAQPTNSFENAPQPYGAGSRSAEHHIEPVVQVGKLKLYTEVFRVTVDDEVVPLTSTEYQLLLYLAERAGRLQSRGALLQKVWGYEGNLNTRTVDTHIKRLRQKLGKCGPMIETVHGFGYQLSDKPISTELASDELSPELDSSVAVT